MTKKLSFSKDEIRVLLQYWLQKLFPALPTDVCLKASGISTADFDTAKNKLLQQDYVQIFQASGMNILRLSGKGDAKLFASLLLSPDGQSFFRNVVAEYEKRQRIAPMYSCDTTGYQMNLLQGMMFGEDCAQYLFENMARYKSWLDASPCETETPVEQFLGQTIFNMDFLDAGIASPRVAAVVLARLGYRMFRNDRAMVMKRYFSILMRDVENWMSFVKLDKHDVLCISLAFYMFLFGRLDLVLDLKRMMSPSWVEVFSSIEKGETDETLSGLKKLLESLPMDWQNQMPRQALLAATFIEFVCMVGLRGGKALILQTEKLLAAASTCFDGNSPIWQHVRQIPFPEDKYVWSEKSVSGFDAAPLTESIAAFLAATLLRDTPQHLVPGEFWRFTLKAYRFFRETGLLTLAWYIKSIMQTYLPDNDEWAGIGDEEIPISPVFLPERKRSNEEMCLSDLIKMLQEASERRGREEAEIDAREFAFQIDLKETSTKGFYQVDRATPCIVNRTKRGLTRLKRVALSRVRRGQYDQIMDRTDHVIANLINISKNENDEDTDGDVIHFNDSTAAILETPRKFFLKGDTIPMLFKVEPLRLSLEVNKDSLGIKIPAVLPDDLDDPYFMQKTGRRAFSVTIIDKPVKELFVLLQKWGKDGQRKIKLSGRAWKKIADLVPSFSQISPYLQILGTGSALEEMNANTVEGEVNLELRISTTPTGAYRLEMFCHPIPDDPSFEIKPGQDAAGIIRSSAEGAMTVTRDLRKERFKAESVINACPALDAHPPVPYQWIFPERTKLLEFIGEFERMQDPAIHMTFPENQAWNVVKITAPLELLNVKENSRGWFDIGAEIRVDENRVLQLMDLLQLYRTRQGNFLNLGDNQFAHIGDETMRQLELLDLYRGRAADRVSIPQGFLPLLADLQESSGGTPPPAICKIRDEFTERLSDVPALPRGIDVTLRPYQADAYRWLMCHYACNLGGVCLADDMGLGKTIELLVFLKAVAARGPSLVVVPTSLASNWCSEGLRFTPTLSIANFAADRTIELDSLGENDVVVVSYGLLINEIERFEAVKWNVCVLDEAQAIKNASAQRTVASKRITAQFRIVATGTPIENNLTEFWSLFDFIMPGLLGTRTRFKEMFDDDTTRETERPALRKLVTPFILRRLKRDVLQDLPPKTEILMPVEFNDDERVQYEGIRRAAIEHITDASDRMSILASLMRLRRTCCHPSLVVPEYKGSGSKIEKLLELAEGLKRNGHRALVFSQFVDMLTLVKKELEKNGYTYQYLDGSTMPKDRTAAVNAFQSGNGDFFLISLKAGGTGLTLTAADYVIILDPWWNPAVENQAADRAHRIGQQRPVTIYRLVTKDTVEEKVIALHAVKQRLVEDMLADTGQAALTPEELMALFT